MCDFACVFDFRFSFLHFRVLAFFVYFVGDMVPRNISSFGPLALLRLCFLLRCFFVVGRVPGRVFSRFGRLVVFFVLVVSGDLSDVARALWLSFSVRIPWLSFSASGSPPIFRFPVASVDAFLRFGFLCFV